MRRSRRDFDESRAEQPVVQVVAFLEHLEDFVRIAALAHSPSDGFVDVLWESGPGPVDVLVISVGAMASDALAAADRITGAGYSLRIADLRWVTPLPPGLGTLAAQADLLVTVEDGVVVNGVGSRISQALRAADQNLPVREIGIPAHFLDHGKVNDVRAMLGLTPQGIARRTIDASWVVVSIGACARA